MKKALAWLLIISMTAALAVGGTLAYLTDTDEDVNVMTVGKVKIDQLEYERVDTETKDDNAEVQRFHNDKPLFPAVTEKGFNYTPGTSYVDWEQIGKEDYTSPIWDPAKINNEVDKMVFVKNKGDYDAYVRSVFAFEAGNYETLDQFRHKVHLNLNERDWTWDWTDTPVQIGQSKYFVATATYNKVLAPGALTEISLSQIALDSSVTNEDVAGFGETYQVLVQSQAVQATGFENAAIALEESFGSVPTAEGKYPFENDTPIQGIDLRTALHYLNGNKNGTQITAKVTNVIYALNSEYPDIVDNYDGTFVDEEQDVPVYAYYVPNDSNYDVYFLADDVIYSPKDSNRLYKNMRALQYVDTHNYDVSRVENMHELFRYCHSLKEIDVSHWDTGNVTIMSSVFDECIVLPELDVSKWNTSKVETMAFMFFGSYALEWLDVSNWDTGNVVAFNSMFSDSKSNTGRMKINNLDFSNWDMSSATDISYMFYGCGQMTSLDLSSWDVSKVTTMNHTFCDCFKMESYNFSGWNTESLTIMNAIFNGNESLKVVDVSDFDTQNVYDFCQVFDGCYSLEEIIGLNKWDTSKADRFITFLTSTKVRELDLSSFDASQVKYMKRMFYNNSQLTTIYVGDKWNFDASNLDTTSANAGYSGLRDMFESNPNLVGGNGSTPAGFSSYATVGAVYGCVDTDETPGLLTHIKDKPVDEPTE